MRRHPPAPLALGAAPFALGIWAGPLLCVPWPQALGGALTLATLALAARGRRTAVLALLAGALLLGLGVACPPDPPALGDEGRLLATVTARSGGAAWVDSNAGPVVLEFPDTAPPPGTHLAAWTRAARPETTLPGAFPRGRRAALAGRPRRRVRQWVPLGAPRPPPDTRRFRALQHGGLLQALATGDRSALDPSTTDLLTRTGTRHLLAISGLHVGLVAALVWAAARALLGPLRLAGRPRLTDAAAAAAALTVAALYAQRVGWPVSTQRAVVMVAVASVGRALQRDLSPWNLLGVAAWAVLLVDPTQARAPGFLLSFGAVVGMLTVTPWVLRWVPPDVPWPLRWLVGSVAATVGAQAGTLPVSAWLFQQLAPLGAVTNLVAGPLLGGVAVPAALVGATLPAGADPLAQGILWVADRVVEVALTVLRWLDVAPWAPAVGPLGALALACALATRRRPLLGVGLVLVALAPSPRLHPSRLVVTFLAVGQGDAALVELPDGRRWLVDGGPSPRPVLQWLRRRGIRRLDAVVLSHPHPDHSGGLDAVLQELEVGSLWVPRPPERGEQRYLSLWHTAFARGVPIRGPTDDPGPGLALLHPQPGFTAPAHSRVNEESLVLQVTHGRRRVLLTGDIEAAAEAALAPRTGPVDVVKAPHHGSRTSSSTAFAEATRPAIVVVSCGPDSRFGHPHPQALAAWRGARWLRTDRDGTVEVSTDGDRLWVRTWRVGWGWRGIRRPPWRPSSPRIASTP